MVRACWVGVLLAWFEMNMEIEMAGSGVRGRGPGVAAGWVSRGGWLGVGLAGLTGAAVFALGHPLGWQWALMGLSLFALALLLRRDAWLVLLPGLVPVVDLAPWSGMIYFTESDALVLATLAVFGLREAWRPSKVLRKHRGWSFGPFQMALLLLMALSYGLSTAWAPLSALGQDPNLLMGYESPLNGARLTKGFLLAVLVLPLISVSFRADPTGAPVRLGQGVLLGLLLVSLAAWWERLAFPGLSDFAANYRTTALFWEMNVGGAQLDGWLAISLPFMVWALLRRPGVAMLSALAILFALAGYATFTTYSRGLYAGALLGISVVMALMLLRSSSGVRSLRGLPGVLLLLAAAVVAGWLLSQVFQGGGYRGAAAILGVVLAVFWVGPAMPDLRWRSGLLAVGGALLATVLSLVLTAYVPKGAYGAYGFSALLLGAVALATGRRGNPDRRASWLVGSWLWLSFNAVLVNVFWGGLEALFPSLFACLVALVPLILVNRRPAWVWHAGLRTGGLMLFGAGLLASVVVILNTYFASTRLGTIEQDLEGREAHWSHALSLAGADEQWLGIGTGRFSDRYFWTIPETGFPGKSHIESDGLNRFLRLSGPSKIQGQGAYLRITQRVDFGLRPPMTFSLKARAPSKGGRLHVEVCRKHLLYEGGCATRQLTIPAGPEWQRYDLTLPRDGLGADAGFPPRLTTFALANPTPGQILDLDALSLVDARGRELMANGDFTQGGARWFFSSDHNHLPWHAKNMWLHFWVEQGWLGLAAFSLLSLAALYRVTLGRAAKHPLAPALAGGLMGVFVVGAFDSLVDAPRMAFLIFMLTFVASGVKTGHASARGGSGRHREMTQ